MKKLRFCILILSISLALSSCTKNQPDKNEDEKTVTIVTLRGPSAISMVKMIEEQKKIAEKSVSFQIKNEPMQIRPSIFQGKIDFAVVPTNMAAILYNKDVPYQLAAVPVWGTLYLFGQDTTIKNWNDLKGKEVHLMAKGMTPDVMFRYLLNKKGLIPGKDIELDYSFPTHIELANAVAAGKAKLGVISEPLVSMVMEKNTEVYPVFSLNEEWEKSTGLEIPQTALLVKQDFARDNPEFMQQFLNTYQESVKWVNTNKEEASRLIVKHNILQNEKVALESIPRCNMQFKTAPEAEQVVREYLKIFYDMNPDIVGGKIPDENFFYKK